MAESKKGIVIFPTRERGLRMPVTTLVYDADPTTLPTARPIGLRVTYPQPLNFGQLIDQQRKLTLQFETIKGLFASMSGQEVSGKLGFTTNSQGAHQKVDSLTIITPEDCPPQVLSAMLSLLNPRQPE